MQATFKSTIKGLEHHNGIVEVIGKLSDNEYDYNEVGQMWVCESNGEQFNVFDDELTFIEKESCEDENMRANAFLGTGPSF